MSLEEYNELTYSEAIERVMLNNGYFAPLKVIYKDFSKYRALTGKTPLKTIQERVQRDSRFTRIGVGVYGLTAYLDKIQKMPVPEHKNERLEFDHARIEGMLLEIGGLRGYDTYTPDKNKYFDGKPLGLIASFRACPQFTYSNIIQETTAYIDVIWFNNRGFPYRVFEVENSTDFRNALIKFFELQDFMTEFFIVSPENRKQKYEKEISKRAFCPIAGRCQFRSYENVEQHYQGLLEYSKVKTLL